MEDATEGRWWLHGIPSSWRILEASCCAAEKAWLRLGISVNQDHGWPSARTDTSKNVDMLGGSNKSGSAIFEKLGGAHVDGGLAGLLEDDT